MSNSLQTALQQTETIDGLLIKVVRKGGRGETPSWRTWHASLDELAIWCEQQFENETYAIQVAGHDLHLHCWSAGARQKTFGRLKTKTSTTMADAYVLLAKPASRAVYDTKRRQHTRFSARPWRVGKHRRSEQYGRGLAGQAGP